MKKGNILKAVLFTALAIVLTQSFADDSDSSTTNSNNTGISNPQAPSNSGLPEGPRSNEASPTSFESGAQSETLNNPGEPNPD